ncbi:MAG: hypothetical protein ACXVRZ_06320 [Gaiellaceae bacterium]
MDSRRPSRDEGNRIQAGRSIERLGRRIEQTLAISGHPLQCADCDRMSCGRATGWTMHLRDAGQLYAFCPECGEAEFG